MRQASPNGSSGNNNNKNNVVDDDDDVATSETKLISSWPPFARSAKINVPHKGLEGGSGLEWWLCCVGGSCKWAVGARRWLEEAKEEEAPLEEQAKRLFWWRNLHSAKGGEREGHGRWRRQKKEFSNLELGPPSGIESSQLRDSRRPAETFIR